MLGTVGIDFRLHTGWAVLVAVAQREEGLRLSPLPRQSAPARRREVTKPQKVASEM